MLSDDLQRAQAALVAAELAERDRARLRARVIGNGGEWVN